MDSNSVVGDIGHHDTTANKIGNTTHLKMKSTKGEDSTGGVGGRPDESNQAGSISLRFQ